MQILVHLSTQMKTINETKASIATSQALIDQHVRAVNALKTQNDLLKKAQQLAGQSLKKQDEVSRDKLSALEVHYIQLCHYIF